MDTSDCLFERFKAESFWIFNIHLVSVTGKSGNVARSRVADLVAAGFRWGLVGEDCLELD